MTSGNAEQTHGSTKELRELRSRWPRQSRPLRSTFRRVTLPSVEFMRIKRIVVQSSAGRYSVVCGAGVLRHAAKEIVKLGKFSSIHVVSSAKVWRAIGKSVRRGVGVKSRGAVHLINDKEVAKNLRTVELLTR